MTRKSRRRGAAEEPFARVRTLCMALPGVYEKEAWGEATYRVERGKMFAMCANDHHDDGRIAVWCLSTADGREVLLENDPEGFFVPPYVGPSGWVGVRLDRDLDWALVAEVLAEAHRLAAPKTTKRAATKAAKKPAKKGAAKKPAPRKRR